MPTCPICNQEHDPDRCTYCGKRIDRSANWIRIELHVARLESSACLQLCGPCGNPIVDELTTRTEQVMMADIRQAVTDDPAVVEDIAEHLRQAVAATMGERDLAPWDQAPSEIRAAWREHARRLIAQGEIVAMGEATQED
jgi:hypothetical protein